MGDPAGVGPETIVGAWADPAMHRRCRAVVVGWPATLRQAAALLDSPVKIVRVSQPEAARSDVATIPCLPIGDDVAADVSPAVVDARAGRAAHDAVKLAAELALAGRVDAMTTAPLNKMALRKAGVNHPGHTELLAELCSASEVAMMLYLARGGAIGGRAGLGIVHVTLHVALRDVFDQLTPEAIVAKVRLVDSTMRAMIGPSAQSDPPRIGICALNPHAGEEGLFGREEIETIGPAVEAAREAGLLATGPYPADTLISQAVRGHYDAVVAMYHDQGHIALKLLDMHRAVNITLGLPIVRTSVAHGTAFDLAWQGRAESSGMVEALRVAASLARVKASYEL